MQMYMDVSMVYEALDRFLGSVEKLTKENDELTKENDELTKELKKAKEQALECSKLRDKVVLLENFIVGRTDCSEACSLVESLKQMEKENEWLQEKVDRRNKVLRAVVESHREFVADIRQTSKNEKEYDKNCIDPTLAKLTGFKATKEQ